MRHVGAHAVTLILLLFALAVRYNGN